MTAQGRGVQTERVSEKEGKQKEKGSTCKGYREAETFKDKNSLSKSPVFKCILFHIFVFGFRSCSPSAHPTFILCSCCIFIFLFHFD
jgi:hypothetical protein